MWPYSATLRSHGRIAIDVVDFNGVKPHMLPSQNARPSESRSHMYRRGKSKPWLALGGVVVVVIAGIFIVRWASGRGEPASAEANPSTPPANLQTNLQPGDQTPPRSPPRATPPTPSANNKAAASNGNPQPTNTPAKPATSGTTPDQSKIAMGGKLPGAPGGAAPNTPANAPLKNPPTSAQTPAKSDAGVGAAGAGTGTGGGTPRTSAPPASGNKPTGPVSQRVQTGLDMIAQNKPVEARRMLSDVLSDPAISPAEADRIRTELSKLSDRLVFSPEVATGDTFASVHKIASGESLAKLPKKLGLDVDWRFLQRINKISDPGRLQVGQRVKVLTGPFHAIVDKRTFRLDLYMGNGSERVFVRSFVVGLGEYGATPEGEYVVKANSKLVDPAWANPRTGERFAANDPKNPLGEYWIGLVGVSDNIKGLEGYGVHGTIDPDSIGQEKSMGCVRMHKDDIALMYEVLVDNASHVEIRGNDWP